MNDTQSAIRIQLARQVAHWSTAAERLQDLEALASPSAWHGLESYLGMSVRRHLAEVVGRLNREAALLKASLAAATSSADLSEVRRRLLAFRRRYLRVETTLDFFADAINTHTNPRIAAYLRACDTLAHRSMAQILDQMGKPTPVVLTYIDKGLGASILKAGLRLWDRTSLNPVAAIKVTRHNLYRPTALIHEAGHQVAHILGWNEELASLLGTGLRGAPPQVGKQWAGWASEIAADAFAFAHTGYGSVAALHDVVDGGPAVVFRHRTGDPHPISYLRVLLGVAMCREFYGAGPWEDLVVAWAKRYPLSQAPAASRSLIEASLPVLPEIVRLTLCTRMRAFDGQPLAERIRPERVSPKALLELEQRLGKALYTSMHWVWTEALRLLALTGLKMATADEKTHWFEQQEAWMLRLGGAQQAA